MRNGCIEDNFIFKIKNRFFLFNQKREQGENVFRVELARMEGQHPREVQQSDDFYAIHCNNLACLSEFTVSALFCCNIHDNRSEERRVGKECTTQQWPYE